LLGIGITKHMAKQKYYVVWKGRKTGIFSTWDECSAQVNGFTGAEYKSFESRSAAETAYHGIYADYKGTSIRSLTAPTFSASGEPEAESYCVDASCIGNPGLMEYHCVHTTTRQELFLQGPFENGTNNIGEFLAIVHALALFKKRGWKFPLYTDSETAMLWVKTKKCKTKLAQNQQNAPIFELIKRAVDWLNANDYETRVLKWDTKAWGEIPADYGRK
jgi:ribonuclease HI